MCLVHEAAWNTLIKNSTKSRVVCVQSWCFGLAAHLLFTPTSKFVECFKDDAYHMHFPKNAPAIFQARPLSRDKLSCQRYFPAACSFLLCRVQQHLRIALRQLGSHSFDETFIPNKCQKRPVRLRSNHSCQFGYECIGCLCGRLPAICSFSHAFRAWLLHP